MNEKIDFRWLYLLFFLESIVVFFAFIKGGMESFRTTDRGTILLLSAGMLAFVSIFFGIVYTNTREWLWYFKGAMQSEHDELTEKAKESLKKGNIFNLKKIANKRDFLLDFEKTINPELWLYLSVLLYLFTMIFLMLNDLPAGFPPSNFLGALSFYVGFLFTFWLITSIFCLSSIMKQQKTK